METEAWMLRAAEELRPNGKDPTGNQIENYEETCRLWTRKRVKTQNFKCTPGYVEIYK
jgi:hypothetical protein